MIFLIAVFHFYFFQIYLTMTWCFCATLFIIVAPIVYEAIDLRNAVKQMTVVRPLKKISIAEKDRTCNGSDFKRQQVNVIMKNDQSFVDPNYINKSRQNSLTVSEAP